MSTLTRSLAPLFFFTLGAVPTAQEGEVHRLQGQHVAVYNLAGKITLQGTDAEDVTVAVTRGGASAGELRVETGPHHDLESLRIVYPSDHVVYRRENTKGKSSTQLKVRENGTFGDEPGSPKGRRVEIRNHGEGFEAWADLAIGIPEGQRFDLHLGVGHVTVENVAGTLRVDTASAKIESRATRGNLVLDTGSGSIHVADAKGELSVDTGSGSVMIEGVEGAKLDVNTGSGRVHVKGVKVESLAVDTGSGRIEVLDAEAKTLSLDTGSGSVQAQLNRPFDEADIDTGSGAVTIELPEGAGTRFELDTGSGSLKVEMPHEVTRKGRGEREGTIGDGHGRLRVDTGSGSIKLVRRA